MIFLHRFHSFPILQARNNTLGEAKDLNDSHWFFVIVTEIKSWSGQKELDLRPPDPEPLRKC